MVRLGAIRLALGVVVVGFSLNYLSDTRTFCIWVCHSDLLKHLQAELFSEKILSKLLSFYSLVSLAVGGKTSCRVVAFPVYDNQKRCCSFGFPMTTENLTAAFCRSSLRP